MYAKLAGAGTLGSDLILRGVSGYPATYKEKHLEKHAVDFPAKSSFDFLFKWIENQKCFDEYGRVLFWINEPNQKTTLHTDYGNPNLDKRDMFIWITGFNKKSLVVYDDINDKEYLSDHRALIFDSTNWHCSIGNPRYTSWSLRIDGKFNVEWAKRAGLAEHFGLI